MYRCGESIDQPTHGDLNLLRESQSWLGHWGPCRSDLALSAGAVRWSSLENSDRRWGRESDREKQFQPAVELQGGCLVRGPNRGGGARRAEREKRRVEMKRNDETPTAGECPPAESAGRYLHCVRTVDGEMYVDLGE